MSYKSLLGKIKSKDIRVGIVGLGYVGLPLAVEFSENNIPVTGVDLSESRVESLNNGISHIEDISSARIAPLRESGIFRAVSTFSTLSEVDVVIICVPTPLRKSREPDLSYILDASEKVASEVSADTLVILESTSYPGTTREILLPELEKRGFKEGEDLFLAFSPERVDPGNRNYGIRNTPKVVGGVDRDSSLLAEALYSLVVDEVVSAGSCEEAEMVKLLENTFRAVNIGLINEMAQLCDRFGLDIWRIIRAASSKPFGFMPFYPGPGLGGHCIPVDPQFLSWKAKSSRFYPYFIDYADEVNRSMPEYVVKKIAELLNEDMKSVNGAKVLLMGVSYKENVGDVRESPAFDVSEHLKRMKALLYYSDPHVSEFLDIKKVDDNRIKFSDYDVVVILTAHSEFSIKKILKESRAVLDCRGVTLDMESRAKLRRI